MGEAPSGCAGGAEECSPPAQSAGCPGFHIWDIGSGWGDLG